LGHPPLREVILNRMLEADGRTGGHNAPTVGQVLMTAGQQSIALPRGRCDPRSGRHRALQRAELFRLPGHVGNLGARTLGIENRRERRDPEALDEELARLDAEGDLQRVKAFI